LPAAPPVIEKAFVEEFVSGEINRASTILVREQETGNGEVGLKRAWLAGAGDVSGSFRAMRAGKYGNLGTLAR
jgi:hypothetical protein